MEHLNKPHVQAALARAMMQRLRAYYRQAYPDHAKRFDSLIRQDAAGRHLLIEALVPMMNADRREAILLAPVLLHEDVVWLVKQALKYATTMLTRANLRCSQKPLSAILQIPVPSNASTLLAKRVR